MRWVEATAAFRYDEAGTPTTAAGTVRDVTAEVETSEALAVSKRRLELALVGSQTAVWEWRLEDDAIIHESLPVSLGYSEEDLPRTREAWKATEPEGDQPAFTSGLEELRDGRRELLDLDIQTTAKSGEARWMSVRVGSVRDASGKVVRVLGTSVDVTDRKRDEEKMRNHARLLESVVEHLPVMVTFYDAATSSFSWVNRAVEKIFGFSRAAWQEAAILSRVFPDPAVRDAAIAFMRSGAGVEWRRFPLRAADGRTVETTWCNVLLPDGRMMGIGQDLTFELQLQQTQKLESLGVLAGGIAHDFNNLLVGILTNAHLARLEADGPRGVTEILRDIERSAERLAELTKQLLAYAGKGRFVVEPFDLGEVVREMASLLSAAVSKNASMRVDIPRSLPSLEGDVTQIRQVVMNLITNASDALGERHGEIRLRAEDVHFPETRTFETTGPVGPGRYLLLEVTDTGMGMTPEIRRRIFEPFFTTKFAGRGLGLAATVGIVRRHGGALEVTSEVGAGSSFRLYLPVRRAEPEANAKALEEANHGKERSGSPHVVLVVEDDALVATVARRILERHGCTVVLAHDSEEAGRVLTERGASLSLVLLDVNTPRGDTGTLLAQVASGFPALPVLVTSGSSDALAERGTGPNVVGVLPKPFGHDELVAAVTSVLKRPAPL